MKFRHTDLPGVLIFETQRFTDARGMFFEAYNRRGFDAAIGHETCFAQDNHSVSRRHVLRGLHYQIEKPQGKLVRAVVGAIFDVVVDLQRNSATFGKWFGVELSEENGLALWIPPRFAHGFLTLSERAICSYKTTEYYFPQHERTILWDDRDLGIAWPIVSPPILSTKDADGVRFADAEVF
jgi:dTDP-4-dehydrorhamnose 3,5-epimerase